MKQTKEENMKDYGEKGFTMKKIIAFNYAGYLPYWYIYGGDGYNVFHGIEEVRK